MNNEQNVSSFYKQKTTKMNSKQAEDEYLENIDVPISNVEKILDIICNNIVVLNNDNMYQNFLEDLQKCQCVGIATAGFSNGCKSNPSLIAFNLDNKRIVVLDLLHMKSSQFNPFQTDLAAIFESNNIEKVMHCSKYFIDYLTHYEHISIDQVFDTQFADLYLNKREEDCSNGSILYTDCLSKYLRLPEHISAVHSRISKMDLKEMIYKRPLDDDLIHFVAFNAGFLINLRKRLQSLITQPFWNYIQQEIKTLGNSDTMLLEFTDVMHNCI